MKSSVHHHTINNLKENMEYKVRVRAQNEAGVGDARDYFSTIITKDEIHKPTADLSGIYNKMVTTRAGSNLKIQIPISGKPKPLIFWKFKDRKLEGMLTHLQILF